MSSYTRQYAQSNGITCIGINTDDETKTASIVDIKEADGWGTEYYLPETFLGYTVTSIADSAFYDDMLTPTNVTKVYVPASIASIGANAFTNTPDLTDIYIYSNQTTIGANCFYAYNKQNLTFHCHVTSPAFVYAATNGYSIETF